MATGDENADLREEARAQQRAITEAADNLASKLTSLNASIDKATEVGDELKHLTKYGRVNRRIGKWTASILACLVLLSVCLTIVIVNQVKLSSALNNEVTVQKTEALCPLYRLFINSDTPAARENARLRGDDMKAREAAFDQIHKSYAALRCEAFIGGK